MDRRTFIKASALLAASLSNSSAFAFPRLIKFIFTSAPGNSADTFIRILADDISKSLQTTAIVESKIGADGRIAVRYVKNSRPDGSTLLFCPFGVMTLFPSVFKDLPYNPVKDFVPVTQVATYDFGLAAGPGFPGKTLKDLAEWLKTNPEKGNVAVPGLWALPHLLPLKFAMDTGTKIDPISYKGSVPAVTAAMSGDVPLVCTPLADLIAPTRSGAIRLLAVSGRKRSRFVPETMTFIEQGFQIEGSAWYGVYAPAKTPPSVVADLNRALVSAIRMPNTQRIANRLFLNARGTTPQQLAAVQKADVALWAPVIRAAGLHAR